MRVLVKFPRFFDKCELSRKTLDTLMDRYFKEEQVEIVCDSNDYSSQFLEDYAKSKGLNYFNIHNQVIDKSIEEYCNTLDYSIDGAIFLTVYRESYLAPTLCHLRQSQKKCISIYYFNETCTGYWLLDK